MKQALSDRHITCACGAVYSVQTQPPGELVVDVITRSGVTELGQLRRERDELRAALIHLADRSRNGPLADYVRAYERAQVVIDRTGCDHDWAPMGFTLHEHCGGMVPAERCRRCHALRIQHGLEWEMEL